MGGEGSGRHADPFKALLRQPDPVYQEEGFTHFSPLTQIKDAAKTTGSFGANISGGVLFGGSDGTIAQDNSNLFWDDTNNRLGIGTASPDAPLKILDTTGATILLKVQGTTAGRIRLRTNADATPGFELDEAGTRKWLIWNTVSDTLSFRPETSIDVFNITTSGNVGIGTATPATTLHLSGANTAQIINPVLVANLPTASIALSGGLAMVTDAQNTMIVSGGYIVTGTGTNFSPVYCDGTNWRQL